jgi:phospholipid/cholesterol/gamma-HCH transport system substrate-binding protein
MSRSFRLGLFIIASLSILTAGVFLIGDRRLLFSKTYELSATFKTVAGLVKDAEVHVGGIRRGSVRRIVLPSSPDAAMVVVMKMERSTRDVVRTDSVATIQTEGLLGDKFVEVSFGSPGAPRVGDDGRISGAPTLDLADLVQKTTSTMGELQATAVQLKEIGTKINSGQGSLGALVNDKKLYQELDSAGAQAKLGAAAFQENMQALKHNFLLRGFFKKRGYDDSTKLTKNEIDGLPRGPYRERFTYDAGKLFDAADSAKLKKGEVLADAGQALEAKPFGLAVVVAHGGAKGDGEEVRERTAAQAMNVRQYLVEHFKMDDTRVKTIGAGKDEQAEGDAGAVEVLIYAVGSGPRPARSGARGGFSSGAAPVSRRR